MMMARRRMILLGVSEPTCDGAREWRFRVEGGSRAFFTVCAPNRATAESALQAQIESSIALQQLGESRATTALGLGLFGLAVYGVVKIGGWFRRRIAQPADISDCGCAKAEQPAENEG